MSFFRKPELFLFYHDSSIHATAFYDKLGTPIDDSTWKYIGPVVFTHHLSLGDNKMGDFEAFFNYLTRNRGEYVNCQGLVIKRYETRHNYERHEWSQTLDMSFFGLPCHEDPCAKEKELAIKLDACIGKGNREKVERQALENVIRDLETKIFGLNAKNCALEGEVERIKNEKNALISDLEDEVERVKNEKNSLISDLDGKNTEILTLYKQTMLGLKAKSLTLEGEIERVKNEKNYMRKEDTKEAKELELQAVKTELGV